ncbi:phosphatidylinositol transfer protein 3-like [Mangifera indica]|uniref:phosphatidylinositol transfer protein 3-like n=1 Tax=Mangifera indica TaxID=29780 RepID=UPI001CFB026C|nr:phosphatidylinositol transfer protein 3-like [Mangifera indica]XP_044474572.1 phosphatidylinositol transfer protein 3-like [Mangifera indica]XP_044474573.1 phosphatidylinositol transfer protein 3-like [Mangifera indica]XP_044474574.1 phosphatidylinositol transfer protein 3-like [Mangifera indica]
MSDSIEQSHSNGCEKPFPSEEQQAKIHEVRRLLGPLSDRSSIYCSDASISRYLMARNWNIKKATKMLKETLKWRAEYKPEEIHWDEVAHEAETGKIYRSNYVDKYGRTVLVMRPACQNSKSTKGQIRYLVYCMENAISNLPPDQEQMVWLIDFQGFNLSHISVKVTRETAHVLQDRYPERLGLAILYNPPKFFEPFWTVVKPFLEPKTQNKVKFVYSDDANTKKMVEELFDMDQLESAFGGNNTSGFNINKYAERMREDDKRMPAFSTKRKEIPPPVDPQPALTLATASSLDLISDSDTCDNEKIVASPSDEIRSEAVPPNETLVVTEGSKTIAGEVH